MKLSRPLEIIIGYSGNWLMTKGFDLVLYPFVIYKLGLLHGGVVMAFLSLIVCLLTLWFYDWAKRDWLGIEFLKGLKSYDGPSRIRRFFSNVLNRTDAAAFIFLSMRYDPFITTAYLRRGSYSEMTARDWRIFFGSVVVSNVWWALLCWGGIEAIRRLWMNKPF